MDKKILTINGNNFSDIDSFYSEIDEVLTKNIDWKTGHNLNAFVDVLRGGFGVHEYEEPITLIWTDFAESRRLLGDDIILELADLIESQSHIEFSVE